MKSAPAPRAQSYQPIQMGPAEGHSGSVRPTVSQSNPPPVIRKKKASKPAPIEKAEEMVEEGRPLQAVPTKEQLDMLLRRRPLSRDPWYLPMLVESVRDSARPTQPPASRSSLPPMGKEPVPATHVRTDINKASRPPPTSTMGAQCSMLRTASKRKGDNEETGEGPHRNKRWRKDEERSEPSQSITAPPPPDA